MDHSTPTLRVSSVEQDALAGLSVRAAHRVRAGGSPVLVSYTFTLEPVDPLMLAQDLGEPGDFRFYWEKPADGFALAAGGAARRFRTAGCGRFAAMAGAVETALRHTEQGVQPGCDSWGPFLLGGFSFFDDLDEAQWQGFGPAQLVVPDWLVRRSGQHMTAVVSAAMHAQDTPERIGAGLAALADRVREAATRARAVGGADREPGEPAQRQPAFHRVERSDGREVWLEVVRKAREEIRQGRLTKVVLARALDLACEAPPSPYALLARLRETYGHCYSFMIDPGQGQMFLGATPERLARFSNGTDRGTVHLGALAGTVPRGTSPQADEAYARHLLDSHKEREEHRIVVEGIVNAVSGFGAITRPSKPELLRLNNVQHLFTPITLNAPRPVSVLSLLEKLHPTPAVGGHPQAEAFRIIRESEHFERGWYAGPVGWMNARGEGEFAVALRSGTMAGDRMRLFAGGGIVAESDPEREYEETQVKFQPLLTALVNE